MTSKRQQQEEAGRWLRRARERRGFRTAGALARQMGVSDSLVSRIETGATSATDERAEQIANALEIDIIIVRRNLGLWVPKEDTASTRGSLSVPTDEELRNSGLQPETVEALLAMRRSVERFVEQRNEAAIRRANRIMDAVDDERDAG